MRSVPPSRDKNQRRKMEAHPGVVKGSPPITARPVMIADSAPRKRTCFLVDSIVRNTLDSFNSPCYGRWVPDSTHPVGTEAQGSENSKIQGGVAKPSTVANPRKSRSSFSVEQVLYMERVFEQQKYLGSRDRQRIAEQLQMTEAQVKTWFQNRRMKMKRKQSEVAERRAKLSFLNNLAHSMQPSFHGYQSYCPTQHPVPPPAPPAVLVPRLSLSEGAWPYQSPLNFPPMNQQAPRSGPNFLQTPSWEGLPERTMDGYTALHYGHMQSNGTAPRRPLT